MTGLARCDEIIRLIDQVLVECGGEPGPDDRLQSRVTRPDRTSPCPRPA